MTANKPETALHRAPTFSLPLASRGGISTCEVVLAKLVQWFTGTASAPDSDQLWLH